MLAHTKDVASHVDRLFSDSAPLRGRLGVNPIIGGYYVGGENLRTQKRMVCLALRARKWFAVYGPQDAQPLPLSDAEIEDRKYAPGSTQPSLSYIVSCFGYSLRANDWDFNSHPSFDDFARGVMASERSPDFVKNDEALRKRYPPCPLSHLNAGNCWDPPQRSRKR